MVSAGARVGSLAWLLLRGRVRQEGPGHYTARVVVLSLLNVVLFAAVFATAGGGRLDADTLVTQYGYFLALAGLTAGVGAWETEVFAGVADQYLLHPWRALAARLLVGLVESSATAVLFAVLLLCSPAVGVDRPRHLVTAALLLPVFLLLGVALGYCFGFRHEKAVNNFLTSVAWVLGLGPGPFLGSGADGAARFFPGGHALRGDFTGEWTELALVALAALALTAWGNAPRRHRSFAR